MNNQMNSAVRKIHNLLSSGAVTVTGPNQPRILKQKVGATTVTPTNCHQVGSTNRCYVCDDPLNVGQAQHPLTEMQTSHTATKFPNKIGQLVGDAYMVIVSVDDVVCSRCTNLINYLDRLENDVERVRANLMNLLHKKYGLNDEGGGSRNEISPPIKVQKLNSGAAATRSSDDVGDLNRARKQLQSSSVGETTIGKQSPPVSAVQQIKISTQPSSTLQQSAGTQTLQRKTTKIYKCTSCDYKTSDMRLFNAHFESCKQQNFQCKNCKNIFPNFGAMKQHMVSEHNTPMDNTCAVCHVNFVNDASLRKHMETNHSTNVLVTSTTTVPATQAVTAPVAAPVTTSTPLYTCNHCQFKSTDKTLFDEHLRKHLSGAKPKPFKCRLCAQRFETRDAATVHAKQHQPNYFKCGTCAMSFPKREQLVKHFEVHQPPATPPIQQTTIQAATTVAKQPQQALTTQKLLQDTIDEALSESVSSTANIDVGNAGGNNIRFFSCHLCSLTFIQENYYNQHMETHRRDKKNNAANAGTTVTTSQVTRNNSSLASLSSTSSSLLSEGISSSATKSGSNASAAANEQANANAVAAGISEADIESIFEKMHSDKSDSNADAVATSAANTGTTNTTSATTGAHGGDGLVITSQEGSGGITFNITIPQADADKTSETSRTTPTTTAPVAVSIDMPTLDQPDETTTPASERKTDKKDTKNATEASDSGSSKPTAMPVSMPSLDDDNDAQEQEHLSAELNAETKKSKSEEGAQAEKDNQKHDTTESEANEASDTSAMQTVGDISAGEGDSATAEQLAGAAEGDQHVAMELDEAMQAQVESGQIKFILNENGHLLQLDNHIITDADGNQILVQDPEQIQQLLQSVGVLQSGDGLDGETLQMMTDANGQMVLVHNENNEAQLIDASLLNADGQLVIQQGHDGDLGEGAHVIGEDGTRIPVSVSYTADGQPIVQVQQQVLEANEVSGQHVLDKDAASVAANEEGSQHAAEAASGNTAGGGFFALEDLMQQSSEAKVTE